jgi:DNA polymerase III epsilon subunit-like protein
VCDVAGYRGADAYWSAPRKLAPILARLLDGATIVAANPTFAAGFLTALLRKHGQAATWHYRLRDIGSMAYGYLSACLALGVEGRDAALGVPSIDASTDDFAKALGVDPDQFERHSALGDCRLLAAMLDVIEGRKS